ncbi:MAG: hypothetical protein IJ518_01235 [Clostridia bacterium]|nr:hypothetical protein [Clostridia bacterium]
MRSAAKFCLVIAGFLLVISTAFQALALCSVLLIESTPAEVFADNPWLVPLWIIALVLLIVGFILCLCLQDKGGWLAIPLVVAGVASVLALIVALTLKDGLMPQINHLGNTQGLTTWKLVYRHLSSVAAGALTVLGGLFHLFACREERIRREEEGYKPSYNLDGAPVFKDLDSTIGLETFADEQDAPTTRRPMKRSRRHALRKWQEKQQ